MADALQLPETTRPLTDRQEAFVAAYLGPCRFNAVQAAIAAGYDADTARNNAYRLMDIDGVRARVDAYLDAEALSAREVLSELRAVALAPTTHFMQVIQAEYTDEHGRTHDAIIRMDYNAKLKALELLGKAHGLFSEKIDITVRETKTIIGINLSDV